MEPARKRALTAAAVLLAFATASAPVFAQDQPSLAEQYLSRSAEKSKHSRNLIGGICLGGGVLFVAGGLAMTEAEDDPLYLGDLFGAMSMALGGVMALGGGYALLSPSPAERAYERIVPIKDAVAREAACADALAGLSKKGKRARMIGGALFGAVGIGAAVASVGKDASKVPAGGIILYGGVSAYLFLVKGRAEKTYQAYLEQSRVKPAPQLVLGFGPRRSIQVGLAMEF